jgi:hypothetical protein
MVLLLLHIRCLLLRKARTKDLHARRNLQGGLLPDLAFDLFFWHAVCVFGPKHIVPR